MEDIQLEEGPFILLGSPSFSSSGDNNSSLLYNGSGGPGGNWTGSGIDGEGETYVPYGLRPETYIIPVLFAIIFIIGIAGNGTLIVIFLKHRTMRNVPNM